MALRLALIAPLTRILAGVDSTQAVIDAMTQVLPTIAGASPMAWFAPTPTGWRGIAHTHLAWAGAGPCEPALEALQHRHGLHVPPLQIAGEPWTAHVAVRERRRLGPDHVYGVLLIGGAAFPEDSSTVLEALGTVFSIAMTNAEVMTLQRTGRSRDKDLARGIAQIQQQATQQLINHIGDIGRPGLRLLEKQIVNDVDPEILAGSIEALAREIRTAILSLDADRPYLFDLPNRLKRLVPAESQNRIPVSVEVVDPDNRLGRLDSLLGEDLYLWFEEAIGNAQRHSRATRIEVGVAAADGRWVLGSVRDNGIGIDEALANQTSASRGMRYLAGLIARHDGQYAFQGAAGSGFELFFRVPLASRSTESQ